jgi:hypothetical protein
MEAAVCVCGSGIVAAVVGGPRIDSALMTATALAALTAGGALPGEAAAALAIAPSEDQPKAH